jgi:hypothetical protein
MHLLAFIITGESLGQSIYDNCSKIINFVWCNFERNIVLINIYRVFGHHETEIYKVFHVSILSCVIG